MFPFPAQLEKPSSREGGDVCLLLIMVCSRYPREYRHYETILKKKCLRKLKYNVWERKTKWILLEKAEDHYRKTLLHKHINLWLAYLNECYKKKINRRAADALREDKLKSKGILALKKNVEQNWMIMRICSKKYEWNLKYKCWHQWKHYTEKRLKVKEVKMLADRIREERLRVHYFYLLLFRYNQKTSLENAYKAAADRHNEELKKKCFKAWKTFTKKRIWKVKIENLAVTCYEEKLKERFLLCWQRQVLQKNRYKYQMQIIRKFYENYLLRNYLSRWLAALKKLQLEKKICNFYTATNFYERRLLERSFRIFFEIRERKRRIIAKTVEFHRIYVDIYLNFYIDQWVKKRREKIVWNDLEEKATKWREDFLLETYFFLLRGKYQKIVSEREEMASVVRYSNAIITHRAFTGWRELTEQKVRRRMESENAYKLYTDRLMQKSFQKWKKYTARRSRKKMAAGYYRFILLSKIMNHWRDFFMERKKKLAEARILEQKHSKKLLKNTFDCWKNEVESSKRKIKSALAFCRKLNLSKTFQAWKKVARMKMVNKNRYNRNRATLNDILVKNSIFLWYEMTSVKKTVKKKVEDLKRKQDEKCLRTHYDTWWKFVEKMKSVRQNVEVYPQLRSEILLEQYLNLLLEAIRYKKDLGTKLELAVGVEQRILRRRYLRRWLSFVYWKKDTVHRCLYDSRKLPSKEDFQVFVPVEGGKRRKPMIPGYLKADFFYVKKRN